MGDTRFASFAIGLSLVAAAGTARAGGLTLPGVGPTSTSRAGAWVADADDPTAIAINPAGLAKQWGTVLYVGSVMLDYSMQFTRRGSYDSVTAESMGADVPWAGMPYATVKNDAHPPIGFGPFQALPLVAVSTDLGLHVKGLRFGAGVFVPTSYPTRDMGSKYTLDDPNVPPPPTRYDVVSQQAAIIYPSIAVAYRVNPKLDVGVRFSPATANLDAVTYTWGRPNYDEWSGWDSVFHVKASDNFVPVVQAGALYRPTEAWEIGASVQSETDVHAMGTGTAVPGAHLSLNPPAPLDIEPRVGAAAKCADGGTKDSLKACVDLGLPMTASVGARYILRDVAGREKGDVEYDVQWEHWSAVSDYKVVVDAYAAGVELADTYIKHGLQDTYSGRVGGSWSLNDDLSVRGGLAYDTKAARDAWERADLDGAARTTVGAGVSWHGRQIRVDASLGYSYEGTRTQGGSCDPSSNMPTCTPSQPDVTKRTQPDPILPISSVSHQLEDPINSGTIKSSYFLFSLAAVYHF